MLIITYYWPPAGGSGVQRWLKFVKYLQSFGIEPIVYTVANPNYPLKDDSLQKEIPKNITILKHPIREPNSILSFFKKRKTDQTKGFLNPNPSFIGKILQYIRANYFIPDARKFWVKPSVKYLEKYLLNNSVDAIITTGPPHSLHLIGLALKDKLNIKWISDFRDPWVDVFYNETLNLNESSKKKNLKLQIDVLKKSDTVITVSDSIKKSLQKYTKSVELITNGYDENLISSTTKVDTKFSISHIGYLPTESNSDILWQCIEELCNELKGFKKEFVLKLVGSTNPVTLAKIQQGSFKENIEIIEYVSHEKVLDYQRMSQVLLLLIPNTKNAKGIVTGKIFEYLHAKRPILAIGPKNGDAADIINETDSGQMVDFNDQKELKKNIVNLYNKYKEGSLVVNSKNIERYHRKQLTKQLASVIKKTVEN